MSEILDTTQYKKKILHEFTKTKDNANVRRGGDTDIFIYAEGTNELLYKAHNKVILPGSISTAQKHFDIAVPPVVLPNYNTVLGLENIDVTQQMREEKICLFAVGTDGCGPEASQVLDVDYKKWIQPQDLVPFRYQLDIDDISVDLRDTYFGRKLIPANNRIAYYFKKFDSNPEIFVRRLDGTPVDNTVYTSLNTQDIETYVELRLKITRHDCRDFFIEGTGINDARVNSISLLTAWLKNIGGFKYFQNIQPMTKLHIPTELLVDPTKGIDIVYQIYY